MILFDSEVDGPLTQRHANRGNGPKTHALIIGVGYYHHLPGGDGETTKDHMDLEQLSSPPMSARAFAKWVCEELDNPSAPLGSVELLTSPSSNFLLPNGGERCTKRATMPEIERAFDGWYERCDSHSENVAVFYFCGHGVMRGGTILLPEDYGMLRRNPFKSSIDINLTWEGMAQCKASTQCYFIDSCRQVSWNLRKQLRDPGTALILPKIGTRSNRDAPLFMATGPSNSAYGLSSDVTIFTKALLDSLKRGVCRRKGCWLVTTTRLSDALSLAVQELGGNADRPQFSGTEGILKGNAIHRLTEAPEVAVWLCCEPELATQYAELEMFSSDPPNNLHFARRPPVSDRWKIPAPAGHYTARARFPSAEYKPGECSVWADPPGPVEEIVRVEHE
jgi:hypothetical protein